jgi:hypothetical protein
MVTRPDGKTVAIEVKSSPNVANAETKHLHWLRKKLGSDLLDAVVVNTGDTAYRRADSIAVIPAAILGP